MGFTQGKVSLYNPASWEKTAEVNLLVDGAALFTSVPQELARRLGLKPAERRKLKVYGGTTVEQDIGGVVVQLLML